MNQAVSDTPLWYHCPVHGQALALSGDALRCSDCERPFPITPDGIALLDVVQSPEAEAFDSQHRAYDVMSQGEIDQSVQLARRFLALSGIAEKSSPRVLDVACGKGELTVGALLETRGTSADIYAFDHSRTSLEALVRTAVKLGIRDSVKVSTQDATALFFQESSFDLVCGNAVLHHFLDWREFVGSCVRLLRKGGRIVLAEPFTDGYVIPMIAFTMAARSCGMSEAQLSAPDMGLFQFITQDIGKRIRGRNNRAVLSELTDKHLFLVEDFARFAGEHDLAVEFENYEHPSYYDVQLDDLLKTYRITNPQFTARAREIYAEIREYFGGEYATLFSHFKFVTLRKR